MPGLKRKRNDAPAAQGDVSDDEGNGYEVVAGGSVDISSALTGAVGGDGSDDDIEELIRSQQDKRKFRDGKEALKHVVKGKKQGQAVTGGGSFQSMGELDVVDFFPFLVYRRFITACRSSSFSSAVSHASWLSCSYSNSACLYSFFIVFAST